MEIQWTCAARQEGDHVGPGCSALALLRTESRFVPWCGRPFSTCGTCPRSVLLALPKGFHHDCFGLAVGGKTEQSAIVHVLAVCLFERGHAFD